MPNQTPLPALANSSRSTSPDSPALQALDRWRPEERSPLTKAEISTVIAELSESIKPATMPEYLQALKDLIRFATAFGIPCPDPETVQEIYREQLGKLPGDLLKLAISRIKADWVWGNRMPFPAEIAGKVKSEHAQRIRLLSRARVASLKATDPIPPEKLISAARRAEIPRLLSRTAPPSRKDDTMGIDPNLKAQWERAVEEQT